MRLEPGDDQYRSMCGAVRVILMAAVLWCCSITSIHAQELEHWQRYEILRDLNFNGLEGVPGGDASLGIATALADNLLTTFNDPTATDPLYWSADELLLQDATEGSLYLYPRGTNINDINDLSGLYTGFNDVDAYLAHRRSEDLSFNEDLFVIQFVATIYAFFYNRMPDIYHHVAIRNNARDIRSQSFFGLERDVATSQYRLQTELDKFKGSALMSDPLVRIGLRGVSAVTFIEDNEVAETGGDGYSFMKRSPSQFDNETDTVYINTTDLHEYGYVVLLHELVQAGLKFAHTDGYLAAQDLTNLNTIAKDHFPSFSGYMNAGEISLGELGNRELTLSDLAPLSNYKAFAIGYTYKLLKQHFTSLPAAEQVNATRYFSDVERNRYISPIYVHMAIDVGATYNGIESFTLYGKDVTSAEIDRFLTAFTRASGAVSTLVNGVADKAQAGVSRDAYRDVFPAINTALLF